MRFRGHDFAEEPRLPALAVAPGPLSGFHGAFHGHEFLRARTLQRIHGAGANQALDHAPVDGAQVHLLAELVQEMKQPTSSRALPMASTADWPQVLHRAQAEADALPSGAYRPA